MTAITPGSVAPDFTLDDLDGQPFTLFERRGHRLVLLVFNRGFM